MLSCLSLWSKQTFILLLVPAQPCSPLRVLQLVRSVGALGSFCLENKIPKELQFWKQPLSEELNVSMGIKDCLEGESLAAQHGELLNHCLRHADFTD